MMQSSVTAEHTVEDSARRATGWRASLLRLIGTRLQFLAESRPRAYLLVAAGFAAVGYSYLLLFPLLVFTGGAGLYAALFGDRPVAWSQVLVWSVMATFSALASYRVFRFRPALPAGIPLDQDVAPALLQLVAEQRRHYQGIRIDRIVLTGDFDIVILKTPARGLPVWSISTLVIGLPLIRCLSVSRFQCLLARRLGQFSIRYNWLENWLYKLREIWPLYCDPTNEPGFGFQPIRWFFRGYAPLYAAITVAAARLDELAADGYAMELFSDEQVLDAITTEMVCRTYLEEKYWPVIRKLPAGRQRVINGLHSCMVSVLRTGLQADGGDRWLAQTLSAEPLWDDPLPALARRVDNIGHTQACMDTPVFETAARAYLGTIADNLPGTLDSKRARDFSRAELRRNRRLRLKRLVQRLTDYPKSWRKDAMLPGRHASKPAAH